MECRVPELRFGSSSGIQNVGSDPFLYFNISSNSGSWYPPGISGYKRQPKNLAKFDPLEIFIALLVMISLKNVLFLMHDFF